MIDRTFRDIAQGLSISEEVLSYPERFLRGGDLGWSELLRSERILIYSEAGLGKTYECQSQQRALYQLGEPAFFVELAQLARSPLQLMLSPDEEVRFEAWLQSPTQHATFFLDSYDELRLTQGSFKQALLNLAKAVPGRLGRVRLVLTSRPIPLDEQQMREILPVPPRAEDRGTAAEFAEIAMGEAKRAQEHEDQAWRRVLLVPLSDGQIAEFAAAQGVVDAEQMIADLRRRNALDFARRPQDLIELCADWREQRRIRTHSAQVLANIEIKLAAREDRAEKVPLSLDQAKEGAARLALAAVLSRKLTIRHSAEADRNEGATPALDPATILSDWTAQQRQTLLERPLFGFSSYGRVRFHHRSVIEFLAAQQLKRLSDRGMSWSAMRRLLFATTAAGERVVKPSLRPIAAWLAGQDERVFAEVLGREPDLLLTEGDPEALLPAQRRQALSEYFRRFGAGGWQGLQVPAIQIHRFASADLGGVIAVAWRAGIENPEVKEVALALIGAGQISECADLAYDVALDSGSSVSVRMHAIDALSDLKDGRLAALSERMGADPILWPDRLARWSAVRLFPEHLSVGGLKAILGRVAERRSALGEISWQFPRAIAGMQSGSADFDRLRSALFDLVTEGLQWRKEWPPLVTMRGFLVPALAATCTRQLKEGVSSPDVLRSAAVALRLTKPEHGNDEPSRELRELLAASSSETRERTFLAEAALLEELSPAADARNRLFELTHRGALALNDLQDGEWVRRMLCLKDKDPKLRALLLEAALVVPPAGSEWASYLTSLRPLVADNVALSAVIDDRSKPPARNRDVERWEVQAAKQKRQRERRQAKARASWLAFWRQISERPAEVFGVERADNTAWNLWRAMQRTGNESRSSGWNRAFVESHFGSQAADRLRHTLMGYWRAERPTVRSERAPEERNTYLTKWQLGLAGISAEAEDRNWAAKLSPDEAELAVRYAPVQLNGYPGWLVDVARAHPGAITRVLGAEVAWELAEPASSAFHASTLQNVEYAATEIAALFVPGLLSWLQQGGFAASHNEDAYAAALRLERVVAVILRHGDEKDKQQLLRAALGSLGGDHGDPFLRVWLPTVMRLSPPDGVVALERLLASAPIEVEGPGVQWFGTLFGDRLGGRLVDLKQETFTPDLLLRLVKLAYEHVRLRDDVDHEGSYTPGARDHAEWGRNAALSALLERQGSHAWAAKIELANDPLLSHIGDRIIRLARERAAEEVDTEAASEAAIVQLNRKGELPPSSRDEMFELMRDRLGDLEDILLRDDSPRAAWALIQDETVMRQMIAHELRGLARGAYKIDQEAVTADNKETDIRLLSVRSDHQAVIELKVGEKDRSANELRVALHDQLVRKYMGPESSRAGCLLITVASERRWRHPETNDEMDFVGLIQMLNEEARSIVERMGGELRLMVKGLDLRPRLPTEKEAKKRS